MSKKEKKAAKKAAKAEKKAAKKAKAEKPAKAAKKAKAKPAKAEKKAKAKPAKAEKKAKASKAARPAKAEKKAKPAAAKPAAAKPAPAAKPAAGAKPAPGAKPAAPPAKGTAKNGAKPQPTAGATAAGGKPKPKPRPPRPDRDGDGRPRRPGTRSGRFYEDGEELHEDEDGDVGDADEPEAASAEDVEDELALMTTAVETSLDSKEALLRDALRAQRARDFVAADRHLARFRELAPDDVRGQIHLANLRRAQGDRPGALEAFKAALKRDKDNPLALWWKADYHISDPQDPDLAQAQRSLERIVELFSRKRDDTSRQWTDRAKSQLRFCESRRLSLESHRFLKGKRGGPPDATSLKKAKELLTKARDVYPEDPRNHMNLGSVELQLKSPEAAIEHCKAALERNGAYARAHLVLGHAYRATGQLKLAKDAFLQCIDLDRLNRDSAEAWRARREVEQELARARRRFFNVLASRPQDDGTREPIDLGRMKGWVTILEGEPIVNADLVKDPRGAYLLTAFGEKHRYRVSPGPEGLVVERV